MKNNVQSILKFNLDTQEGRDAHFRACKADQAYRALSEIDDALRQYTKYETGIQEGEKYPLPLGPHTITQSESLLLHEFINNIREQLNEIVHENSINLSEEYR